jgi:Zn-dependent M28 family amino/carboxypeptidase
MINAYVFRNLPLIVLLAAAATCATAQIKPDPAWSPDTLGQLRQLQHTALDDDYAYQRLSHLADNVGPRATGSPQAAAAVDYVADEMRRLGLDVTLEKVTVPRWVRGEERAELVAYPGQARGTTQKIVVTALGAHGVATFPEGITAEIVVANSLDELATMPREKVAGKIVVFNEQYDRRMEESGFAFDAYDQAVEYRTEGRAAAARQGAVAMLVRSVGGAEFRLPHTGETDYFNHANIPAAAVTAEDADLMARLSVQGPVRLHLLLTSQMLPDAESYNVIADLKGSEHPEQVVIVSGHLDSWDLGTGALDDGAGIAMAMATAHLVKQLHLQPKRTIRVVAWMSEEPGLLGARVYAKEHAADIANQFAGIETDSGAGHPMGIYICGDESLTKVLQPVAGVLQISGAGILRVTDESGPDLIPLNIRGMPAFSPIQDTRKYFDYHHTAADTLDKVDRQELRENVVVVSVLAYALATMTQELPRKPLPLPDWLK